ncbi:hypothetical protein [Rhizobium mongolense]|uniref:Uncharacterized protein n=1 Tax=Rhizobium mongolense TaxID=57676 RepID=A0A7W6RL99_9HYPH|nr:hypothetical protein [Rhizobium mongolense]MBB4273993.1 hypothetical protein [Rhizobium mongolense]
MPASIHVLITKWRIACQLKPLNFLPSSFAFAGGSGEERPGLALECSCTRSSASEFLAASYFRSSASIADGKGTCRMPATDFVVSSFLSRYAHSRVADGSFLGSICAPAGERRVSIPALYPKTTKARPPTSWRFFLYSLIKKRPPRSARRLMRIRYPATTVREG